MIFKIYKNHVHPENPVILSKAVLSTKVSASLRLYLKTSYNVAVMLRHKGIGVLLIVSLLLISATAKTQKMHRIPTGVWGGDHIHMKVGAKSATIEYDCANGVIEGPLVVNSNGEFNLHGTHTMERGGPIRPNVQPNARPATYTGSIKGNTMTLTVKLEGSDDETFTLEQGKPGELVKCK